MAKIFLFEKEKLHGLLILKLLHDLGHEVVWVKDKEEAETVLKDNFDIFILNIARRYLDRIDYRSEITKIIGNHFKDTPVIFITGIDNRKVKELVEKFGAVSYLVKPIMPSGFKNEIQKIVKRKVVD